MKVLITATVQSHICQFHKPLMKMLKKHGCEVYVAARNNLAEKNGLKMEYADKVFDVPFCRSPFHPGNVKAYRVLAKVLKEQHFDVIHANTPVGGIVTRLAASKYRKQATKVFYTVHGFHFYKGAPVKNWLLYYPVERLFAKFTDKLITITNEDYTLAAKRFPCEVCYIHGVGANSERFCRRTNVDVTTLKEKLGFCENDRLIINVGELLPNKNQKTAVLAMKLVVEQLPTAKLLIAGNGPERERLIRLINENGLSDALVLLDYVMNLPEYVAASDVLVSCSYREGLPMNVLEAMMMGKPIVASDNRGHRELVHNGINGFLVAPNDVNAFAAHIVSVLNSGSMLGEASEAFAEPFKDYNVVKELASLYEFDEINL